VGDRISGLVVDLRVEDGRSGPVPVVVLSTDTGSREIWAGAIDLRTRLADADVQLGDKLMIEFTGERHTGQASPMKLFTVNVERGSASDAADEEPPY
jgi:hypothetical protein